MYSFSPLPLLCLGALATITIIGCKNEAISTYPASGRVTFGRGEAAVGAMVVLHPKGDDVRQKSFAKVREDGSFTLSTYAPNDGAPTGKFGVTITWAIPSRNKHRLSIGREVNTVYDRLNGRYGDPSNPRFSVDVKPTENEFDFHIE